MFDTKKRIAVMMVFAMTLNSAPAFSCEPAELQAQQDMATKARGAQEMGAEVGPGEGYSANSSEELGDIMQQDQEEKKGLFGVVMDCGMLFLSAGMGPGAIKNAACEMKCFTKIAKACDFKFTPKGGIKWKQGGEANVLCPPIFPLVMAFK